ncbi:hypothetical protein DB31_5188 [Hyalangium minutum]|uniref:Uncharacterized protein n=1 Tax=Hyalangium minutum TaxID=394096 RepID=A0A085WR33_9BACT|nr:hypothetical protein DB31_5188 [Hyalangium minutum]
MGRGALRALSHRGLSRERRGSACYGGCRALPGLRGGRGALPSRDGSGGCCAGHALRRRAPCRERQPDSHESSESCPFHRWPHSRPALSAQTAAAQHLPSRGLRHRFFNVCWGLSRD